MKLAKDGFCRRLAALIMVYLSMAVTSIRRVHEGKTIGTLPMQQGRDSGERDYSMELQNTIHRSTLYLRRPSYASLVIRSVRR